jgi:hypothetical protein
MMPRRPTPGGGQIERQRRSQAAGADQQHRGFQQFFLARLAEFRQGEMAAYRWTASGDRLMTYSVYAAMALRGRRILSIRFW